MLILPRPGQFVVGESIRLYGNSGIPASGKYILLALVNHFLSRRMPDYQLVAITKWPHEVTESSIRQCLKKLLGMAGIQMLPT